ncbi:MAG: hypothetical protein AABX51_02250 [Nanoarchaeota archaeon]
MNKILVFDTGPIISLGLNNLMWMLKPLKEKFGGEFYITHYVKEELVDIPLKSKKFKLEAFQVEECINAGILKEVHEQQLLPTTRKLMDIANNIFVANNQSMTVVQFGEISTLALACHMHAQAVVVDERATRELMENPEGFTRRLSRRFGVPVTINKDRLMQWRRELCDLKVIRSVELATVAFEMGLLDRYLVRSIPNLVHPKRELLDAVLWGMKLNGCAVSEEEIRRIMKLENTD